MYLLIHKLIRLLCNVSTHTAEFDLTPWYVTPWHVAVRLQAVPAVIETVTQAVDPIQASI